MRTGSRGFTYLALLLVLALGAAALAAAAPSWQAALQRARETELLFRGGEFAQALAAYREATPEGQPAAPATLDELLVDSRIAPPRHHLRRLYPDPFTGRADWELERDEAGGIVGLRSRAELPAMRRSGVPAPDPGPGRTVRVSQWVFRAAAPPERPASGAAAPEGEALTAR